MAGNMIKLHQVDYISYLYGDTIKSKVREITFQLTSACNLNCTYCYEHHKKVQRMSEETGKKIVDYIISEWEEDNPSHLINKSVRSLIFTFVGGEPFLEVKVMDSILEYFFVTCAKKKCDLVKGFQIGITSNGTLYFQPAVQSFIKKYRPFLSLTISIDGVKELHDKNRVDYLKKGSFDKAMAAFQANKEYGRQHTKMTFVPSSFPFLFDSVKFMLENDVAYIACNYAYEPEYTPEDAHILYQELKKVSDYMIENKNDTYITMLDSAIGEKYSEDDDRNYCGGTGDMLCFSPDGKAYPCIRYAPISIGDEKAELMCVGDYNGIYNTPRTEKLKRQLQSITRTSQSPEKCINCAIATGCGWCSGYNYEVTGDPNKRLTHICWAHKGRVLSSCYFYNKKFLFQRTDGDTPKRINLSEEDALKILTKEEWEELLSLEKEAIKKEQELRGQ